jgi:hypothetical protein
LGRLELGRIWEGVADSKGRQPRRMDFRETRIEIQNQGELTAKLG